jgi:hypothetical protein
MIGCDFVLLNELLNKSDVRTRDTGYFYVIIWFNIEKQRSVVTRHLTQLSESVDDLEISVNRCKQLVLVEREKDHKFARTYDKYHKKTQEVKYKAFPLIMSR